MSMNSIKHHELGNDDHENGEHGNARPLYPDMRLRLVRHALVESACDTDACLTLVCAAPGSGKTVFLQQLQAALPEAPGVMRDLMPGVVPGVMPCVLLDLQQDDHARNGLKMLCENLSVVHRMAGQSAVPSTDSEAALVSALTFQLLAGTSPLTILIDGLQAGRDERLIRLLLQLALLRPAQVRWFLGITGNIDPGLVSVLPASDLRLITAAELGFSLTDIRQLCSLQGMTPEQADNVWRCSGGWPLAVMQLLCDGSTTLLDQRIASLLPRLAGGTTALSALALLDEWDLPAATALLGVAPAEAERCVRELLRLGFVRQDQDQLLCWQHGVRQYLLHRLQVRDAAQLPDIYLRGAQWLHDSPLLGWVQSALQVERPAWALLLAGRLCRRWLQLHESRAILQLLRTLQPEEVLANTNLLMCQLWALIMEQQLEQAVILLEQMQPAQLELQQDVALPFPELENTRQVFTLLIRYFGDASLSKSQRITQLVVHTELPGLLQPQLLNLYANIQYSCGLFGVAREAAQRATLISRQLDNETQYQMARSMMMLCDFMRGQLDSAIRQTEMDAAELRQRMAQRSAGCDPALVNAAAINDCARAYLHYETGDIADADRVLTRAMSGLQMSGMALPLVLARITRAKIMISRDRLQDAETMLAQLDELVELQRNTRLQALVCYEKMRLRFYAGQRADDLIARYDLASRCVQVETLFLDEYQEEHLFWLKSKLIAYLMDADFAAASEDALKGMIKSLHLGCWRHRITFCLFKALSEFRLNRYSDACASYNRALLLCQQAGYRRVLIDDSFGMGELWSRMRQQGDFDPALTPAFLQEIQASLEFSLPSLQRPARTVVVSETGHECGLTDKEVEILTLLAEGLCNKKIGSRASIALTTVKWHLQNIFSKLDARNRTEAVLKAQELCLVEASANR